MAQDPTSKDGRTQGGDDKESPDRSGAKAKPKTKIVIINDAPGTLDAQVDWAEWRRSQVDLFALGSLPDIKFLDLSLGADSVMGSPDPLGIFFPLTWHYPVYSLVTGRSAAETAEDWLKGVSFKARASRVDVARSNAVNAVARAAWVLWKDDPERVGDLVRQWTPESEILAEAGQKMLALGREQGYLSPGWAYQRIERWLRGGVERDRNAALMAAARLFDREPERTLKVLKEWLARHEQVFDDFIADLCGGHLGLPVGERPVARATLERQLERAQSVVDTLKETHQSFLDAKETAGKVLEDMLREKHSGGPHSWLENAPAAPLGSDKLNPQDKDRQHFWEGKRIKKKGGRGPRRKKR
jgi:hypothetical protein